MRRILAGGVLVLWIFLLQGCGSEVERTTGVVSGSAEWSGSWPQTGTMMVVLFVTPPWEPDFQPGPPAAVLLLTQPDTGTLGFSFEKPQVSFGTYGTLLISWMDPENPDAATRDHPVSVYGTSLDAPEQATPIVLSKEQPDVTGLVLPPFELFESAEGMRSHYPSVQ
jgi:hypothetical protein